MGDPFIRPARAEDLPELVAIYNHYVVTTHFTFDTRPFEVEERRGWLESFSKAGPHRLLVAEANRRVFGYASSSVFRAKPAYDSSVETTIYLDPDFIRQGIGALLYGTLLEYIASEPNIHRAYAGIALPNLESIALHERFGFKLAGTFHEVGFKFDKYWDVAWYERELG